MADSGWRMADGGWRIADGGWRMADGGWRIADGRWRMGGRAKSVPKLNAARPPIRYPLSAIRHPKPCHNQSRRAFALSVSSGIATLAPTLIFLSPRAWLAQWPRRLQLFVVALLLLGSVAQSWHVCAMGGHVMAGEAETHHGAKKFAVLTNADGTPGPVVCACAHEDELVGISAFAAHPAAHGHATCLALLLQTMPIQAGAPFVIAQLEAPRPLYATRAHITPAFAAPLTLRGRAPPLDC